MKKHTHPFAFFLLPYVVGIPGRQFPAQAAYLTTMNFLAAQSSQFNAQNVSTLNPEL